MGFDPALGHQFQQPANRLAAQPVARLFGAIEKHQLEFVPPPLTAQHGVHAEQEFKHRPAAHGLGFLGVGAKSECNRAAFHRIDPVVDLLPHRGPLAGDNRMFHQPRQFLDKAAASGDDQVIIADVAGIGFDQPPALFYIHHRSLMPDHVFLGKELFQININISGITHP